MLRFDGSEATRSVQLYGTDPAHARRGGALPRRRGRRRPRRHELRLPVPKVTRKGGGSALPVHRALLRDIVRAAVAAAGPVPVTIKFRMGVDDDDPHLPRHRSHRRGGGRGGDRPPRPHRRAALQRRRPGGTPSPRSRPHVTHDPRARQRRHLGGPRRPRHARPDRLRRRGGRPRAASVARGCSATSSTPSPARPVQPPPRLGGSWRGDARPRRAARRRGAARSAA